MAGTTQTQAILIIDLLNELKRQHANLRDLRSNKLEGYKITLKLHAMTTNGEGTKKAVSVECSASNTDYSGWLFRQCVRMLEQDYQNIIRKLRQLNAEIPTWVLSVN